MRRQTRFVSGIFLAGWFTIGSSAYSIDPVLFPKDIFGQVYAEHLAMDLVVDGGFVNPDLPGMDVISVRSSSNAARLAQVLNGGGMPAHQPFDPKLFSSARMLAEHMSEHSMDCYGWSQFVGSSDSFGIVNDFGKPNVSFAYIVRSRPGESMVNPTNYGPGSEFERLTPGGVRSESVRKVYAYQGKDSQGRILLKLMYVRKGDEFVTPLTRGDGICRIGNYMDDSGKKLPFNNLRRPVPAPKCAPRMAAAGRFPVDHAAAILPVVTMTGHSGPDVGILDGIGITMAASKMPWLSAVSGLVVAQGTLTFVGMDLASAQAEGIVAEGQRKRLDIYHAFKVEQRIRNSDVVDLADVELLAKLRGQRKEPLSWGGFCKFWGF